MTTAQDTYDAAYPTPAASEAARAGRSPRARVRRPMRRAVAWALRIGLLAMLFVIPLAAYL